MHELSYEIRSNAINTLLPTGRSNFENGTVKISFKISFLRLVGNDVGIRIVADCKW